MKHNKKKIDNSSSSVLLTRFYAGSTFLTSLFQAALSWTSSTLLDLSPLDRLCHYTSASIGHALHIHSNHSPFHVYSSFRIKCPLPIPLQCPYQSVSRCIDYRWAKKSTNLLPPLQSPFLHFLRQFRHFTVPIILSFIILYPS